jgi:hypothetical protein
MPSRQRNVAASADAKSEFSALRPKAGFYPSENPVVFVPTELMLEFHAAAYPSQVSPS